VEGAPEPALRGLGARGAHLGAVERALMARGFLVDDWILPLVRPGASGTWYLEMCARWRGSAEGLQQLLAAAAERPGTWWTAVAYGDAAWQDDVLERGPDWVSADDLVVRLGESAVRQALARWEGRAGQVVLRKQVEPYLAL
jgi:hypothetical protein